MSAAPENPFPPDADVESTAAAWLVKHDRGLSAEEQDEFLQWLSARPEHRESFQRHRGMWSDFDALAQWRPEHSVEPNPDLLARRPASARRWWLPMLAAAALVVMGVWWTTSSRIEEQTFTFEASKYRQETLPDGSVVDLNRGAHLLGQFSSAERRVVLVQGEARFAVAKNPARPFVVRAGGVDVRAVGTAFNVKLSGPNLEVLVTEGTVHLSPPPPSTATSSASAPAAAARPVLAALTAGQRTVIPMAETIAAPVVVAASPTEVDQLLEWRPRLLDFDSTPLADAVAAFNRRNTTQIVIDDESLRAMPIVASIRSDNVQGFVRQLEATMGVQVEQRANGEIGLRRRP
jgi:transmembrane sensor